jgi:hypothetical protein
MAATSSVANETGNPKQRVPMPQKNPGKARAGLGIMCNIRGKNCGKGGGLKMSLDKKHGVDDDVYKKCFYSGAKRTLAEAWDDSVSRSSGKPVLRHVLARRFARDPGARGATGSARSLN